jgi:hypothetical protein
MHFSVNPAANAAVTGRAVIIRPQVLNETHTFYATLRKINKFTNNNLK